MEPLAAPSPPPPPLSFADWRGVGAVTIIAGPILHTLVQVHDQPKGFFDCESFIWYFYVALVFQVFTEAVYCNSKSDTKYDC